MKYTKTKNLLLKTEKIIYEATLPQVLLPSYNTHPLIIIIKRRLNKDCNQSLIAYLGDDQCNVILNSKNFTWIINTYNLDITKLDYFTHYTIYLPFRESTSYMSHAITWIPGYLHLIKPAHQQSLYIQQLISNGAIVRRRITTIYLSTESLKTMQLNLLEMYDNYH